MSPTLPPGWPALDDALAATAVTPADASAYRYLRSTYMRVGAPSPVLRPGSTEQVADAIGWAGRLRADQPQVPVSIRSGGHGISGSATNDGGLVIDLRLLDAVRVTDPQSAWWTSRPVPSGAMSPPR